MTQTLQNYIWLQKLFDKIKHLSKECDIVFQPIKKEQPVEQAASGLVTVVEDIVKYVIELRRYKADNSSIAEEYGKLEGVLQKYQSDIRKHIGIEQQLRLYGESLQIQLEESEAVRSDFLEKTKIMISDIKRDNQKLHEQNGQLKQKIEEAKQAMASSNSRLDFRTRVHTQQNSKDRNSKTRLHTFDIDSQRHNRSGEAKDTLTKTPSKQSQFKIKLDRKQGRAIQPNFHSDRKKDIQKKIRQLVENRHAKKTLFQNSSSYHQLYTRQSKTVANHPHRRSLRKSIQSKDSGIPSQEQIEEEQV